MEATHNLTNSIHGAFMLTLAALCLFGVMLAWHSWRSQKLAVFIGLLAAQSLLSFYFLAGALATLFTPDWLLAFFGSLLTRLLCFMFVSAFWLVFPFFNPRFAEAAEKALPAWPWLLACALAASVLTFAGLAESYALTNAPLAVRTHTLLQQSFAGGASGFLLVAAGFLAYRWMRLRHALYAWLLGAALVFLFAVALQSFQPLSDVLVTSVLLISQIMTMLALLADRARFLRAESEVRRGLWDNLTQLESTARNLTAALRHMSAGVVHVDLEERIIFSNPLFAQLARAKTETLVGQTLKQVLPQAVYPLLVPALQEARRERTGTLEARGMLDQEEVILQLTHAPLLNEHGKIRALHLSLTDATRTTAETNTLASNLAERELALQLLQQGLDQAFDAFALTNAQHEILYANEAFARSTGVTRRELQRQPITAYRPAPLYPWPDMQKRFAQNLTWRGEVSGQHKAGRAFAHEVTIVPIIAGRAQHFFWIERDLAAVQGRISSSTAELEQRVAQMAQLLKISEDIRLNAELSTIMSSVAEAVHALGWQRVAVFLQENEDAFALTTSVGFDRSGAHLPRQFQRLAYADFAPYMTAGYRLSSSFLIKASQRSNQRLEFIPKELPVLTVGEWHERDCLLVPIRAREHVAGVLLAFSPQTGRYPELQQVRAIESYADEAAIAIQNHELLAAQAERERQARVLHQIGNAFRAAGAAELVLAEVAKILAEAREQHVVLALRTHEQGHAPASALEKNEWLVARAEYAQQRATARTLMLEPEAIALVHNLHARLGENEALALTLSQAEAKTILPAKLCRAAAMPINLFALRSRDQTFGLALGFVTGAEKPQPQTPSPFERETLAQVTLTLDNTRLFLELQTQARELLRANSHTAEFLASVSHELRTPLHGILQFSEILLRGKLEEKAQEHVRVVQRSGKALLALINDILDLSKIEAGKMEAGLQAVNLLALLREALETIQPLCEQKGLNLQRNFASSLPEEILTDRLLLRRVLLNLLGNAAKFTERGEIVCRVLAHKAWLTIEVQDTGIGMPKQRLQEIFEPFRQLESGEARKHGGSGLGLAISQKLMHVLGGRIEVSSTLGKGSTFAIHLPLQPPPNLILREPQQPALAPLAQAAAQKKNKKRTPHILVIDDDDNARLAMRFILEDEGYHVTFAENGEEALPRAQREQPDLILMDIMMPKLDGYQVARALKSQKQLKHTPLIALTARAMKGDREKAFAAGCDDYLTKPFETAEIIAMIVKWTG